MCFFPFRSAKKIRSRNKWKAEAAVTEGDGGEGGGERRDARRGDEEGERSGYLCSFRFLGSEIICRYNRLPAGKKVKYEEYDE